MRSLLAAGAAFAFLLLPGCAARRTEPAAAPPPATVPAQPTAEPAPPSSAWQDAALSAGDWTWREGASTAAFASGALPVFLVRCTAGRQVELVRGGASGSTMTIRTSGADRRLAAGADADGLAARLAVSDALLDEIVFSRGRFAVEVEGAPLLILPAWPEPARVIEECRG